MDRRPPRPRASTGGASAQRPSGCRAAATALVKAPADPPPSWRVVAQRLCDLLLQFPAAAIGGVEWQTLARKYEERHGARLDVARLGHGSPLAAATALLWDVLRLVNSEDEDNPVVAAEDSVVLTPRPGFLGTWPSMYHTLCEVVQRHGSADALPPAVAAAGEAQAGAVGLLLSHLKPLLQSSWHPSFDESGLGFLSEAGTFVRMRKMKHLVQAVLRWRAQRTEWRRAWGLRLTEADRALLPRLELVASKKQTDLVIVFFPEADAAPRDLPSYTSPGMRPWLPVVAAMPRRPAEPESFDDPYEPPPQKSQTCWPPVLASPCGSSTGAPSFASTQVSQTQSCATLGTLDLESRSFPVSPMRGSCGASCSAWTGSGAATPSKHLSGAATVEAFSGATTRGSVTPAYGGHARAAAGSRGSHGGGHCGGHGRAAMLGEQGFAALVPVWFPFAPSAAGVLGDRCSIPTGIVERFRMQIESAERARTADTVPLRTGQ